MALCDPMTLKRQSLERKLATVDQKQICKGAKVELVETIPSPIVAQLADELGLLKAVSEKQKLSAKIKVKENQDKK